jgi:hypothetical protein
MAGSDTGLIIVRLTPEATRRADWRLDDLQAVARAADMSGLARVLETYPVRTRRSVTAISADAVARLETQARGGGYTSEYSLNSYWVIDARSTTDRASLLEALRTTTGVDLVYPHVEGSEPGTIATTYAFSAKQRYLNPAPIGIDATFGWAARCGGGEKTGFVDIEQGWFVALGVAGDIQHEDLPAPALFPGVPRETSLNACPPSFHHGTAVLGIVCGLDNQTGVMGIARQARVMEVASHRQNGVAGFVANAITAVLGHLQAGDVLLIEYQDGSNRPAETDPLTKQAIGIAIGLGMIVVEPAGNLNIDLDTVPELNRSSPAFIDSGAIVVAGCKATLDASGTGHDRWVTTAADFVLPGPVPPFLADCGYGTVPPFFPGSNFGSRIDCYAWGENVVSAGYGWLSGTSPADSYTDRFGGTSAAAAIVAGAAVVVQSVATCLTGTPLTCRQMRELLTATGTPRGNGGAEAIGTMPDLKRAIGAIVPAGAPDAPTGLRIIT